MSDFSSSRLWSHPVFASSKQLIPLAGYSGAAIALLRADNGTQFVRKAADGPSGNKSITDQARRQMALRKQLNGVADVPEVMGLGEIDDVAYFDMEFVPSGDVNVFLRNASFDEVQQFAASIDRLMIHMASVSDVGAAVPNTRAFLEKLDNIETRTEGRFSADLKPLREGFVAASGIFNSLEATIAHGDLTFENILVGKNHNLWVFDSIQPPIEHFWMDWSKLFQECEGRWYRHRKKFLSAGITHWLRNRWLRTAIEISPQYQEVHHLLLALTFARILPYANSADDINFVVQRVRAFGKAARSSV